MEQGATTWQKTLRVWLPLLVVPLLSFVISLGGFFVLDDRPDILMHPVVQGRAPIWSVLDYNYMGDPLGHGPNTIRPWPTLTYWLQWRLFGFNAFPFRLWMLALHLGTVAVGYKTLKLYLPQRAAFIAVLLFSGLGIHSSVVVSAAHSPDVWALLFALLALWSVHKERPLLCGLAAAMACLSKESALLLPLVLAAGAWSKDKSWKSPLAGLLAVSVYAAVRFTFVEFDPTGGIIGLRNALEHADFSTRAWMPFVILGHYLFKMFVPIELGYDYTYNAIPVVFDLSEPMGWLGVTATAAALGGVWAAWKTEHRGHAAVVLLGFSSTYGVVSNVIPIVVVFAERLFYGPSLWVCAVVGLLLHAVHNTRPQLSRLVVGLLLATQIPLAAFNTFHWRENITMGVRQLINVPGSAAGQMTLAQSMSEHGEHDAALWHLAIASSAVAHYPDPEWRPPKTSHYGDAHQLARVLDPDLPLTTTLGGFRRVVKENLTPESLARYDTLLAEGRVQLPPQNPEPLDAVNPNPSSVSK